MRFRRYWLSVVVFGFSRRRDLQHGVAFWAQRSSFRIGASQFPCAEADTLVQNRNRRVKRVAHTTHGHVPTLVRILQLLLLSMAPPLWTVRRLAFQHPFLSIASPSSVSLSRPPSVQRTLIRPDDCPMAAFFLPLLKLAAFFFIGAAAELSATCPLSCLLRRPSMQMSFRSRCSYLLVSNLLRSSEASDL